MIEVRGLTVRYAGDGKSGPRTAVDGLDLAVPAGRFQGFLGPNGAGKSTTLAALMGLVPRAAGAVQVGGLDPAVDRVALRALVGYVPQQVALHPTLSVRENLAICGGLVGLSGALLRERVARAVVDAQLDGREASRVGALSGGMQRRLNLVASLLHDPQLVLCDEPTAGVDPQSRSHLFDMLRALHARGRTILYTTHYMEEGAALCSHVAIVDRGRVVAEGPLEALLAGDAQAREHTVLLGDAAGAPTGDGAAPAEVIRRALEGAGLVVAAVRPRQKSLEDVFLALTGHALRDRE